MKNKYYQTIFLLFCFFTTFTTVAQETPPILNFLSTDYGAENQNWYISQDNNKNIYVANNDGLLAYNGSRWTLYPSVNGSVIRTVKVVDDKVYTGSFMEFGYWKQNEYGSLTYFSISETIKDELLEDEIIWNIKSQDNYVIFQSYDRIYFYDTTKKQLHYTTDKGNYYRVFKVNTKVYVQKLDGTISRLENGIEILIAKIPEELNIKYILNIFSINNTLIVLTRTQGLFKIQNKTLNKWHIPGDTFLDKARIFRGIQLRDKSFVLGTISKGVIYLSAKGEIINTINQSTGLSNNTVLNLFEDVDGNVWLALDNGINCLNLKSFIKEYNDNYGDVGTTYASIVHNNFLYIGTNQGLFYKSLDSNKELKFINGTKGQVWSLHTYDNELFCGHNSGVFNIKNNKASLISNISGVWNFRPLPKQKNKILFGHYSGLAILHKQNNKWTLQNKLNGFEISSRFFEINNTKDIWVNHEHKGIYHLTLNDSLTGFNKITLFDEFKGKAAGLTKTNNHIIYANENGVFKLENKTQSFIKDSVLSALIPKKEYRSGKLIFDKRELLWSFNKNDIKYAQKGPLPNMVSIKSIPIENNWRKINSSFENIASLNNDNYIIGKTNGYINVNLSKIESKSHQVFIDKIKVKEKETNYSDVNIYNKGDFKFKQSSVFFSYTTPNYNKYENTYYQYQLENFDSDWSSWSQNSYTSYDKLSYGDYVFKVRSKIGNKISTNIATYTFTIQRPFYLSAIAIVSYVLLGLFLIFLTHKFYKRYYYKKHQKTLLENKQKMQLLEFKNEQEVIRLKNEKLNQEIESKNRELAISTMSIVKRNEVLRRIKKELKKDTGITNTKHPVFKLIDKNLNNVKDRKFFMEAFNNADKEFLTRAKELHPDLSANDLKFCAYLRLNLSSKEIAPLLNISVKSVEVRRSRLRKKMKLSRETNLIEHILSI